MRDAEGAERPIWKILVLRVPRAVQPSQLQLIEVLGKMHLQF
jgi:hypothetical protein